MPELISIDANASKALWDFMHLWSSPFWGTFSQCRTAELVAHLCIPS
jgi:hypothetical protein